MSVLGGSAGGSGRLELACWCGGCCGCGCSDVQIWPEGTTNVISANSGLLEAH